MAYWMFVVTGVPMRYLRGLGIVAALIAAVLAGGLLIHLRQSPPATNVTAPSWTPVTEQRMSHGRFENFTVFVPHATATGFVLLLSGTDGWTASLGELAHHLAEHGALVAGLDVARFNASLQTDGGQCVYPDGDLENLSHFVQAYFRLPSYLTPVLAGDTEGATLAYAALVQSPKGTFAGAVSLDFCPTYPLNKPLCKGSGIEFTSRPQDQGVEFLPTTQPGMSWTVLQRAAGASAAAASDKPATPPARSCEAARVQSFVARVPGATFADTRDTTDAAVAAVGALIAAHPASPVAAVPSALADLPLITIPAVTPTTPASGTSAASGTADTFAIILSGDGGWAGLDKDVAGALVASGVPVIGLDSLRYFWSARTPAGLAADIDRMTRYYLTQLGKHRVLLIGYSQGADVLPFAVNLLTPETRSHVALTALMGMSEHALFEFHMTSWISDDNSGPLTLPEVERIGGMPVLCIYGEEETDTLCPKLDPHKATIVKLKGGHHFDGDYPALARLILAAAAPH
jgi:type IV secretory pathway VirJ component